MLCGSLTVLKSNFCEDLVTVTVTVIVCTCNQLNLVNDYNSEL